MRHSSGRDSEEVGSEMDNGSVLEEGEKKLHALTSEFLLSSNSASPDPDVVGRLYLATFQNIVHHIENHEGDRRLAEDATQEGFQALEAHYQEHKTLPDQPMAFLLTVVRNWLRNRHRDEGRRRTISLDDVASSTLDEVFDPGSAAREPFEAMVSEELKDIADGAVKDLDKTRRKIIELRRKGKSWDVIAKRLRIKTGDQARQMCEHAISRVKGALGAHFSSFVTTADPEMRRWIGSKRSAEQAIDLLPSPYREVLQMYLIEKKSLREIAADRKTSLEAVTSHHKHGIELFHRKYKMTEDELLNVIWHGKRDDVRTD